MRACRCSRLPAGQHKRGPHPLAARPRPSTYGVLLHYSHTQSVFLPT